MIDLMGKGANDIAPLGRLTIYPFVTEQLNTILVERFHVKPLYTLAKWLYTLVE